MKNPKYNLLGGIWKNFILILLIFCASSAYAQKIDKTLRKKKDGFVYIPIIYYTPETKMAGGASVIYYYRNPNSSIDSRPSTIQPLLIYTQNKQTISQILFDNYWKGGAYHSRLDITYNQYPDRFYGIGNDTPESIEEDYISHITHMKMNFQKRIQHALYFGIKYEYEHDKIVEVEDNGLLEKGDILGSEGGLVSGAGVLVSFDNRNNIFYPSSGGFYQLSADRFSNRLGSDFTYSRYTLDLRNYFPLSSSHVLALQGYMNIIQGGAPFQMLSQVGGQDQLRGYYKGRYRDKDIIVFQLEYRMPLWKRLGLAAFAGIGDVAKKLDRLETDDLKYSVGGGIRYMVSREEKINIRFDFGFGEESLGAYFTLYEAF